jgi:stage II sporulation protein D
MRIVPGDSQTTVLVNGLEHKGCLEVYSQDGQFSLINEIDIDHYLKSVLNQQFPDKTSLELLDAIAIIARTNAYYLVGRNPGSIWHVDAKETNYLGQGATLQNVVVDRAVENTRNMILTFQDAPFAATWTEDSAGKTAEFSSIFRKSSPSPKGVEVPLAMRDREKHKWGFSMSKRQLAKIARLDEVTHVDVYVDKQSNKVYALKVANKQDAESIDFMTLQKELGTKKLKSSDFTVALRGDNVVFEGYGAGPGVGLCLYSAEIMAKHGLRAPQMLASFFPNTTLENHRKPIAKAK